jgi:hypothetical protein
MLNSTTRRTNGGLARPARLESTPRDWQSLVEQIAELEDLLGEDRTFEPDAHLARDWLKRLLDDKRRRLRDIDVPS